ncbi:MAG: 2,3-cyclic 3-phosphodiesterase [Chthoniobacter sp.]|jgi:2'-5' RNA ligase|nr:2,3-cyclic 3-phosphodiesterase [Chthoniobacter sp.]
MISGRCNILKVEIRLMNQQIDLFRTSDPPPSKYKLFLAIFPDADTADHISEQAAAMPDKFGLRGKLRSRDPLHVTLRHLGDVSAVPEQMIHDVSRACAAILVGKSSFEVTSDHVMSFLRAGNPPFVLINPNGNAALLEFHRMLITGLSKHWVAGITGSKLFHTSPCFTTNRKYRSNPFHPVSWMVQEAVLFSATLDLRNMSGLDAGRWTHNRLTSQRHFKLGRILTTSTCLRLDPSVLLTPVEGYYWDTKHGIAVAGREVDDQSLN